jgi:hypothetical protein
MRLLLATACLAAVACASATAAPSGRIASRCSASGDSCYGIFKDRGDVIRFQLTLAAKYYNRYWICVEAARWAWRADVQELPRKENRLAVRRRREVGTKLPRAGVGALSGDMEVGSPGRGPRSFPLLRVAVEL